jgi:hypothetical protein
MTDTKHDLQKQVLMIAKSIEYGFDSVDDESEDSPMRPKYLD